MSFLIKLQDICKDSLHKVLAVTDLWKIKEN